MSAAVLLPISPRSSISALQKNSIGITVVIVLVFATLYSVSKLLVVLERSFVGSWLAIPYALAVFILLTLMYFAFLVIITALLMKGRVASRREFVQNANAIGYWFAWRCIASSILMLLFPSRAIAGENIAYVISSVIIFLWFLYLFVSTISVANNTSIRSCWVPGILSLFLSSIIGAVFGFAL